MRCCRGSERRAIAGLGCRGRCRSIFTTTWIRPVVVAFPIRCFRAPIANSGPVSGASSIRRSTLSCETTRHACSIHSSDSVGLSITCDSCPSLIDKRESNACSAIWAGCNFPLTADALSERTRDTARLAICRFENELKLKIVEMTEGNST